MSKLKLHMILFPWKTLLTLNSSKYMRLDSWIKILIGCFVSRGCWTSEKWERCNLALTESLVCLQIPTFELDLKHKQRLGWWDMDWCHAGSGSGRNCQSGFALRLRLRDPLDFAHSCCALHPKHCRPSSFKFTIDYSIEDKDVAEPAHVSWDDHVEGTMKPVL